MIETKSSSTVECLSGLEEVLAERAVNRVANRRSWTDEEFQYIRENIHRMSVRDIAREIGRSVTSTYNAIVRMGMTVRGARRELLGVGDIAALLDCCPSGSMRKLSIPPTVVISGQYRYWHRSLLPDIVCELYPYAGRNASPEIEPYLKRASRQWVHRNRLIERGGSQKVLDRMVARGRLERRGDYYRKVQEK